jgi:hypothetical protein
MVDAASAYTMKDFVRSQIAACAQKIKALIKEVRDRGEVSAQHESVLKEFEKRKTQIIVHAQAAQGESKKKISQRLGWAQGHLEWVMGEYQAHFYIPKKEALPAQREQEETPSLGLGLLSSAELSGIGVTQEQESSSLGLGLDLSLLDGGDDDDSQEFLGI